MTAEVLDLTIDTPSESEFSTAESALGSPLPYESPNHQKLCELEFEIEKADYQVEMQKINACNEIATLRSLVRDGLKNVFCDVLENEKGWVSVQAFTKRWELLNPEEKLAFQDEASQIRPGLCAKESSTLAFFLFMFSQPKLLLR